MPGLTGFEVALADVLMALNSPLPEEDIWAVISVSCRKLEDLLKRDRSTWASGPSLLISLDTLMMTRSGEVQFCPGHLDVNEPGSFAPPETFASNYKVSRPAVEKMYVYSLGMTMYSAAEFETDKMYVYSLGMTMYSAAEFETDKNADISRELEGMLLNMCEEAVDARHSLSHVLEICDEHAQKSKCLDYRDQIIQLLENLMGSSAVLDKLGRSMDDLDNVDKDANLKEELAEALGMQKLGNSVSSLRSSAVSTPLNVGEGIADAGLETRVPLKPEDTTEPVVSPAPVEGSQVSNPSAVKPLIDQVTGLAAACAAVIMAAPVISADVSEAMPAVESSHVHELLQCKASPEILPKLRGEETETEIKQESFPDSEAPPPPLPDSEPPSLPDSEPPPLPEDKPDGEPPVSSNPSDQSGMQSSSGSSIGISHQEIPAVDGRKDVAIAQQEVVMSAPDSGLVVEKSLASSILSASMSLPGASIFPRITRSDSKPNSKSVESKLSEVEATEPVAQSTPMKESTQLGTKNSWSAFHAQLATAAIGVNLRHVDPPSEKSASKLDNSKDDVSPYARTVTASSTSSSIEEAGHEDRASEEPAYAKVDLSKKRKYRQASESETSDLKEESTTYSSTVDDTDTDTVGNKSEASSQEESLVDVTLSLSPQQGALAEDGQSSSKSEVTGIPSKKAKKKKKDKKEDKKLGTMYGDEWPSVTKPSSKRKLKNLFGSDFSRLHGDARKPSIAVLSGVETKLPPGRKLVTVVMLDGTELSLSAEMRSTVKELFDVVAAHLSLKDKEDYFFGLTTKTPNFSNEEWFMDPAKKLKKFAPPGWKDQTQKEVKFLMYFRVKYYVDQLNAIKWAHTIHLYYLQLRHDVLKGQMFCHKEPALVLAAYALQADQGDYQSGNPDYFQPDRYVRESILSQVSESFAKESLPKMHKELSGMSKQQAEIEFVREAQKLPDYGILFYGVSRDEKRELGSTVVGVSVGGIAIYETTGSKKSPVEKYSWHETHWVTYKEKRFTLVPKSRTGRPAAKRVFYTSSYKRSRYLLQMCTDLHHFRLVITKKLQTESAFRQPGEPGLLTESDTDAETKSRSSLLVNALAASSSSLFDRKSLVRYDESSERDDVSFSAEHSKDIKTVRLMKSAERGLGLMIVGGRDLEKGISGIYIKTVKPGGAAALDGKLQPGCQILEVNGEPLDDKSHSDVVELLRAASSLVELKFVETSLAAAFERAAAAERERQQLEEEVKVDHEMETQLEAIAEEEPGSGRGSGMSDVEQRQSDQSLLLTVKLSKSDGGLGLKISGGVDTESRNGAVYVKELTVGGAAERNGRLRYGDCLIRVDDHSLIGIQHARAVQILKETGNTVELEVERFPGMAETYEKTPVYRSVSGEVFSIELTKDKHGLGFGLVGGTNVNKPIIVKSLFEGQVAERDGRLKQGDILLEVNGKRLQSMSHKDVVSLLRQSPPLVKLVIQRPSEPISVTPELTTFKQKSPSPKNAQGGVQPASSALIRSSLLMVGSVEDRSRVVRQEPQQQTPPPSRNESEVAPVDQDLGLVDVFGEKVLGKTFGLQLYRGVKGLGFSVTSGARSATDDSLIRGCFIRSVVADPAMSDGRLQSGDQLIKVKSVSLRGMSHSEAVNVLRGTEGELMSLEIFRRMPPVSLPKTEELLKFETPSPPISPVSGTMPPLPPQPDPWEDILMSIYLKKSEKGYGFSMYVMPNWGIDQSTENRFDCVYVKRIMEGLPAALDGQLQINDRLVEVDDESVEGLPYYQIVNRLRRTEHSVQIKVARREEQRPEGGVENEEIAEETVQHVILPITGRRPASSPSQMRKEVELCGTPMLDRSDINESTLVQTFEQSPTPSPDDYSPDHIVMKTTATSTQYRGKALAELCKRVENQLNDEATANEYHVLRETKPSAASSMGRLLKNKPKNRFANLLPFDHSRVKLIGNEQSDYINASHVKIRFGSVNSKFICTQGPLRSTVGDFWRMVWEQHCTVIAMITKVHEARKDKCFEYWPSQVNHTKDVAKDTLTVTLLSQKHFDTYWVRILRLKSKHEEEEIRNIIQIQFTDWPDHGVPKSPVGLIEFAATVKQAAGAKSGPVVVHCSAGMGRTAVAVVVISILSFIENNEKVDIAKLVRTLRNARPNMIQKKDQYLFCFASLLHALRTLRACQWEPSEDLLGLVVNGRRSIDTSLRES